MSKVKVAILGSGNIGTDLMYKLLKKPNRMELALFAGIDPESDGLRKAKIEGIPTSHHGIEAILEDPDIKIVFDATSAKAHKAAAPRLKEAGKIAIDLTPAAVGPSVVPSVNLEEYLEHDDIYQTNINLISCAAQASIPLISAIRRIVGIDYAELISATASKSIGPGTRQNIDEFTYSTVRAIETIGGVKKARTLPVINPANPPITMSNTIYAIPSGEYDERAVNDSLWNIVREVQQYVPNYRLKSDLIVDEKDTPWGRRKVFVVLNEVEGAGDYLPTYAGNLDIMTSAAWRAGDAFSKKILERIEKHETPSVN